MIAAIRIRGKMDTSHNVERNLETLGLVQPNQLLLTEDKPEIKGMLKKAKDYIAYGEISEETLNKITEQEVNGSKTIKLSPPSGGYKGTRKNVNEGGSLGKRRDMDQLLQKFI